MLVQPKEKKERKTKKRGACEKEREKPSSGGKKDSL